MEILTVGKVEVSAKIESLEDLYAVKQGTKTQEQVRRVEIADALVDTGAMLLSIPKRYVELLGLKRLRTRQAKTSAGIVSFGVYEAVRLTVQGRDCTIDVAEVPDDCPVLIGVIPLELLDFVIDPLNQRLIGNPAHGGEHMLDMF